MKRKILLLLVSIYLLTTSGCTKAYLYYYGVRKPKEETKESLTKFANEIGLDPQLIWTFNDTTSFLHHLKPGSDSVFYYINGSDMKVFNSNGEYMPYQDPALTCPAPSYVITKNMCNFSPYRIHKHILLQNYLKHFSSMSGDNFSEKDIKNYDYIVVFNWQKYMGKKFNKEHLVELQNNLKTNTGCKIKSLLLIRIQKKSGDGGHYKLVFR